MELLLLSNSTLPGKGWMEHALPLIAEQSEWSPYGGVYSVRWRDANLG